MKKLFCGVLIAAYILSGLYVGVAGWNGIRTLQSASAQVGREPGTGDKYVEYDGLTFRDDENVITYIQEKRISRLFPWIFELPEEMILLISSIAFGAAGGGPLDYSKISLSMGSL